MRYEGTPGQGIAQPPSPGGGSSNAPFNFMPTNVGRPGVGSNQYGSLPPWMNVSRPGSSIGPPVESPQNAPSFLTSGINPLTHTQNPTQAQINANLPPGWMLPTSSPEGMPMIPYNPNQSAPMMMNPQLQNLFNEFRGQIPGLGSYGQSDVQARPQFVGSFAQGGTVPTTNVPGGSIGPVYGGSPIAAGSTGIPGGTGFTPGYGLGVPQQGSGPPPTQGPFYTGAGGGPIHGGGLFSTEQATDPQLQQNLFNFLNSQIGKGATPFNLPTALPFGGFTSPGQLNAPADPILQALHSFYMGGQSSMPGANTLATIANQGISALPEWQAMVAAQGQNIAQNEAQLREQSAYGGGGAGSPMAAGLSNYLQGATAQQNALLGQLQQQNILQGQIPVAEALLSGGQQFGQYSQGLAQQNIQNMYNEFLRTSPDYSPLLGYQFGAATTYDPVLNRAGQTQGGALDAILADLGPILTGAGNLAKGVGG